MFCSWVENEKLLYEFHSFAFGGRTSLWAKLHFVSATLCSISN